MDHPTPVEEEVIVRDKRRIYLMWFSYTQFCRGCPCCFTVRWVTRDMEGWDIVNRENVHGVLTFCSARWRGCLKSTKVPTRGKSCGPGGKFLGRLFLTRSIIKRDTTRTTKSIRPFSFSQRDTKWGQNWSSILADELAGSRPRKGLGSGVTFAKTGVSKDWRRNKKI